MLDELGLRKCVVDEAIFVKWEGEQEVIIVLVHIDDCTIAASNIAFITWFKQSIAKLTDITDLSEIH